MHLLIVSIDRLAEASFPGWVECSLVDAADVVHRFHEKIPVVSSEPISEATSLPQEGHIRCKLIAVNDEGAGSLAIVCTEAIDRVSSLEGTHEFTVRLSQLIESNSL